MNWGKTRIKREKKKKKKGRKQELGKKQKLGKNNNLKRKFWINKNIDMEGK